MKKKIFTALLLIVLFTLNEVSATEYSAYLPGGKNYLDGANMIVNGNNMITNDEILVKPNTDYTFSFPGFDIIDGDIYIIISGEINYLNGEPSDIGSCNVDPMLTVCTFTTSSTEDFLSVEVNTLVLASYYNLYGIENFQLEEGLVSTSYEEYIAPFIDTTTPEFSGVGAYITSYQSNEPIASIITNHVIAIDDIDGDISELVVIVTDEYTTNEQIVGDYNVYLSVTDSSGNEALFTLTIMVKDEIPPVISGPTSIYVSVESQPAVDYFILHYFTITDDYDPTTAIEVTTDEYTGNGTVLGTYLVAFDVLDDSLNKTSTSFAIHVEDITNPIMDGGNVYNSYLSDPLYLITILNSLSFTDNYDDLSTVTPIIITNNFTSNELTPGTYSVELQVQDSSSNILLETLTINVIDDVAPIISGPVSYSGSYTQELTLNDFKEMLSVSDNIDSLSINDIYIISDTYTTRSNETGNFTIVFGVTDTNGNEYIHQIDINLFDDVAPVIYVDNYIVTVNLSATFNEDDALKLLLNSNELTSGNYTVTRLIDEYTGNENIPGSYIYKLSFTDEHGNVVEKEFLVKVLDSDTISIEKDLIPRNIAIYSSIFGYFLFIFIKKKRLGI